MQRAHAVPLADAMIARLGERGTDDAYYTLHGFRSSLATWAEDQDDGRMYPVPVIKAALARGKENAVTAAYLRSDQFKARIKLMGHWSGFVTGAARD